MNKQEYRQYLKSGHWNFTKKRALKRAGKKCEVCRSEVDLQVHHKSYENLWDEKPADLIVLCECCHIKNHNKPEDIGQPLLNETISFGRTSSLIAQHFESDFTGAGLKTVDEAIATKNQRKD